MRTFQLHLLKIIPLGSESAKWDMANKAVRGRVHQYSVTDRNFRIQIRGISMCACLTHWRRTRIFRSSPRPCRIGRGWLDIRRRSLLFVPAEKGIHRGKVYCKISLQDPDKLKTKIGTRRGQRDQLPPWLQPFRRRMRLEGTVRDTDGTDAAAQVLMVEPDDHERMIKVFFATKIWVQTTGYRIQAE